MRKVTTKAGFEGDARDLEVEIPDGEPAPWGLDAALRVVGTAVPRLDGPGKASGAATYTVDVRLPGMLHARVFRAPAPGGTLRALDLEAARKAPGVRLVEPLAQPGAPITFDGLDLALVVADTEARAEDAVLLCAAEFAPGPAVPWLEDAEAPGAVPVLPGSADNLRRSERSSDAAAFAAAEAAMKEADRVLERTYETQVQDHVPLEPHAVVVRPDGDGGVTVWASTQGTFSVRDGIAGALRLPRDRVRVICEHMGGGFGCKFGPGAPGSGFGPAAARAAVRLGAPVRCALPRRDQHACGGNRPSSVQRLAVGIRKDGTVLGWTARTRGTAGFVEGGAGARNAMVYALGKVAVEETTVVTHAGPAAAFRAPGHPQGFFGMESLLDEAAEAIGMDPLDLRLKLDRHPVRLAQFRDGARRFGWAEKRRGRPGAGKGPLLRGVGVAACVWGVGGGPGSAVRVTVQRDGGVTVSNGAQDIGTGTRTLLAVIVAEVLGLDPAGIRVELGRTEWPAGPGSGGSNTAPTLGPCARQAAEAARAAILGEARPGDARAWKAACARMDGESRSFEGTRGPTYATYARQVAGAQFAEVEVDADTGVVRVVRYLALQDCGRVVDRLTAESQVIGAVVGGISYALFEERVLDRRTGRLLNGDMEAYRIAGAKDVPPVEVVLTDVANAGNSVGMAGLGEPPAVAPPAAIANAVHHATGARVRSLPITPAKVLAAMDEAARSAGKGGGR